MVTYCVTPMTHLYCINKLSYKTRTCYKCVDHTEEYFYFKPLKDLFCVI